MSETKTIYTAGAVTFVTDPTAEEVISHYFTLTDVGLVIHGSPPQVAFDVQLSKLHSDLDRVRWALGDLCVAYSAKFGGNVYAKASAMVGFWRSMTTIEKWASIARNVPIEVRIPAEIDGVATGLGIYWHQHVTGLPLDIQRELLTDCLNSAMSEQEFERYCHAWREAHNVKPVIYRATTTRLSDVNYTLMTELGLTEAKLEVARVETSQLRQQLQTSATTALAWDVARILAGGVDRKAQIE